MQTKAANHQGFRSAVSSRIRALLESLEARCLLSAADDGLPADDYSASLDAVAYEMPLHAPIPESGGIVQGDINADGRVDGDDYYNLDLAFHGQEAGQIPEGSPLAAADLNADGRVDALDYFLLDSQFVQLLLDAPAAPSALVAEPLSTNEIELTWADNSANETAFTVERRQAGLSEWVPVVTLPTNSISYTNELLLSGTQYHYRVCASNANGHSAYAILASATTLGTPPINAVAEPAAPASLTASIAGPAAVELQWQDSSDNEDAFVIDRQVAGSSVWQRVTTVDANTDIWTDTGLADATNYTYRIAARNFAGTSAFATASAVSLPALPAGGFAAVAVSSSQISLSWTDNSANETGYAIERKTGPAGTWGLIATVAANATAYANTGLTPSTQYLYRVRANSPAGNSGYSAEAAVTTLALSLPAAPTTLTATAASTSQVNLAWTDNAINETGYVIERRTGAVGTWAAVVTVAADTTTYQNTGLSAATQYFFRVRAVNGDGNSSNSAEVGVTTLADVPAAPSALAAQATSPDQINLSWTDNAINETGFGIERKVSQAGTWSLIATVGANATSYAHTGLSASTQYVYRVRATNANGPSAWSAEVAATTGAANSPAAPAALSASPFSAARIDLSWTDNADNEDGFIIEQSADGVSFAAVATLPASTAAQGTITYSVTSLQPDTEYFYRVRTTNSAGSAVSALVSTMTLMNATVDGDGWTTIVPSADTRIVYVSSSEGDDANDGLSADAPVQTVAKAKSLVRNGMPDWILLRRGDTFLNTSFGNWDVGGRSATEPTVISAYGTGDRPIINSSSEKGLGIASGIRPHWVVISGLEFRSGGEENGPVGISLGASTIQWAVVEDCVVTGYVFGITANGSSGITIRRSVIADNYSNRSHSSGFYASSVNGLTIEDNVFDHNGWHDSIAGATATVFNHNIYLSASNSGVIIRGNIIANASSHGLQARSGGEITGNLFIDNPIHMSFGYVNGATATPGGVQGTIAGNVFMGGRAINSSPRGWAIEISNTKPGGATTIENNIFTGDTQNAYAAIRLDRGSVNNPEEAVGINDLTIRNNTVSGWHSAISIRADFVPGGTGEKALNGLVVEKNDFQQLLSGRIIDHGPVFSPQHERWQDNRYWNSSDPSTWFRVNATAMSWDSWQTHLEPTATSIQLIYQDPMRTVASYNSPEGDEATLDVFLTDARQQLRDDWRLGNLATRVIAYVAGGFAN